MTVAKVVVVLLGAAIVATLGLAGFDYRQSARRAEARMAVMRDITFGRTTAGALHSQIGQFVCFDQADAFRGRLDASDSDVSGRADAVRNDLTAQGRCTFIGPDAKFDMTADGRERFATVHGAVDLWSAPTP